MFDTRLEVQAGCRLEDVGAGIAAVQQLQQPSKQRLQRSLAGSFVSARAWAAGSAANAARAVRPWVMVESKSKAEAVEATESKLLTEGV
eukprot:s823_g7.t1